jgi:hypothetical protein
MGNTVNQDNFNETMDGYFALARDFMWENLRERGYSEEQLQEINEKLGYGIHWAKDSLTMSEARKYRRKHF